MFFNVASEFKKTKRVNITLTVAQKLFLKVQNMFYLMCLSVNVFYLLAKLYIASFLSWKDKCLSAGVFPNDLAAGCEEDKRQ